MKPYTYLIGWPEYNTWYYGVRYAKGCSPSDLWNPYKTSSTHVTAFIAKYGEPSVRQIRHTFNNVHAARIWEERVLKRMKVVEDSKWLNRTNNKSIAPLYGKEHPHYGKTGPNHHCHGIKRPDVARQKNIEWTSNNPMKHPDVVAKKVAATSGDKHHMKRSEVAEKVSGKNNWVYRTPGALDARRQQFVERNKARKGTRYKRLLCQHCSKDYASVQIKQHEKRCSANLTSSVGNTRSGVYNSTEGNI
jgi:hypothetical protein